MSADLGVYGTGGVINLHGNSQSVTLYSGECIVNIDDQKSVYIYDEGFGRTTLNIGEHSDVTINASLLDEEVTGYAFAEDAVLRFISGGVDYDIIGYDNIIEAYVGSTFSIYGSGNRVNGELISTANGGSDYASVTVTSTGVLVQALAAISTPSWDSQNSAFGGEAASWLATHLGSP